MCIVEYCKTSLIHCISLPFRGYPRMVLDYLRDREGEREGGRERERGGRGGRESEREGGKEGGREGERERKDGDEN